MQRTDSGALIQTREGVCSCLLSPTKMPKTLLLCDLMEKKGLKILLLEFIISIGWGMCGHNTTARKAAQNLKFLFQIIFKNVNCLEESFIPLLLRSAYGVSASEGWWKVTSGDITTPPMRQGRQG